MLLLRYSVLEDLLHRPPARVCRVLLPACRATRIGGEVVTADLSSLLAVRTPGDWKVVQWSERDESRVVVERPDGGIVFHTDGGIVSEEEANIALAALAPVLAQACLDAETALAEARDYIAEDDPGEMDTAGYHSSLMDRLDCALASLRAATGSDSKEAS